MDNSQLRQLCDELYAPFPLEAHSIREGHKNKAKTKIQWFVYLDRAAIQRRLDSLLPLQWSFDFKETHRGAGYVTVTIGITINGITRVFNGGQDGYNADTPLDSDLEKGAFTEAFRRAASLWGCGLYLYAMDFAIWTDAYPDNNWDEAKKRQNEAWAKFEQWYNRQFGVQNQPAVETIEAKTATPKSKPTAQPSAEVHIRSWTDFWAEWKKAGFAPGDTKAIYLVYGVDKLGKNYTAQSAYDQLVQWKDQGNTVTKSKGVGMVIDSDADPGSYEDVPL